MQRVFEAIEAWRQVTRVRAPFVELAIFREQFNRYRLSRSFLSVDPIPGIIGETVCQGSSDTRSEW